MEQHKLIQTLESTLSHETMFKGSIHIYESILSQEFARTVIT